MSHAPRRRAQPLLAAARSPSMALVAMSVAHDRLPGKWHSHPPRQLTFRNGFLVIKGYLEAIWAVRAEFLVRCAFPILLDVRCLPGAP